MPPAAAAATCDGRGARGPHPSGWAAGRACEGGTKRRRGRRRRQAGGALGALCALRFALPLLLLLLLSGPGPTGARPGPGRRRLRDLISVPPGGPDTSPPPDAAAAAFSLPLPLPPLPPPPPPPPGDANATAHGSQIGALPPAPPAAPSPYHPSAEWRGDTLFVSGFYVPPDGISVEALRAGLALGDPGATASAVLPFLRVTDLRVSLDLALATGVPAAASQQALAAAAGAFAEALGVARERVTPAVPAAVNATEHAWHARLTASGFGGRINQADAALVAAMQIATRAMRCALRSFRCFARMGLLLMTSPATLMTSS